MRSGTGSSSAREEALTLQLLNLFSHGLIEAYVHPPRFAHKVSRKPQASPLARHQAQLNGAVVSRRYEMISLDPLTRELLPHLDGKHDRVALADKVRCAVGEGRLAVSEGNEPLSEIDAKKLEPVIKTSLDRLCHSALLVA